MYIIHRFSIALKLSSVSADLESIPANFGCEAGYILDWLPATQMDNIRQFYGNVYIFTKVRSRRGTIIQIKCPETLNLKH